MTRNGGEAYLTDCVAAHSTQIHYESGSSGTMAYSQMSQVYVYSGASPVMQGNEIGYVYLYGGSPVITGNTISSSTPFYLPDPDVDVESISGNTYTSSDPTIAVWGDVSSTSRTLSGIDGLIRYVLNNNLYVNSGKTLTLSAGVYLQNASSSRLYVNGQLDATGVTWGGSRTNFIHVRNCHGARKTGQ